MPTELHPITVETRVRIPPLPQRQRSSADQNTKKRSVILVATRLRRMPVKLHLREVVVVGSIPTSPIQRGCSSVAEHEIRFTTLVAARYYFEENDVTVSFRRMPMELQHS